MLFRIVAALAFVVLAVTCALGAASPATLADSFSRVLADPWGRAMVVDLNAGFVAFVLIVWLFEPRRGVAVVVTALTPVLGNFVPLAWLILRARWLQQAATLGVGDGPSGDAARRERRAADVEEARST